MEASRLIGCSLESFHGLHRFERIAWMVRAERQMHPAPVERDFWGKIAELIGRAVRG